MIFLLKRLEFWFMFAGTQFFAAGAVIDGGITDGGTDSGAIGTALDPTDAGGSTDGSGSIREDDSDSETAQSGTEASSTTDGRTLPKDVQSALKALKEAHPEHAKALEELRKGYFGHRQHSEFFKSPTEARQAKATLDLVGGSQGIADLQSKVAAVELVDSAFEQGDTSVIDDVSSDYPDGFKKLVPYALEKLQKMDAAAFGQVVQPHVFAALEHAGLGDVIEAVKASIEGNDLAKAKDLVARTLQWYQGQKQQAGNRPKGDDPERAKFQQEQQKFRSEQEQAFRQDIGRQTLSHQQGEIEKVLNADARFRKLSADAKKDLVAGVNQEVNARLKADGTYQGQMKAFLGQKSRDRGQIVSYVNSTVSEVVSKAAPAVMTRRYGTIKPMTSTTPRPHDKTGQPQAANPAGAAIVKLTAKPNRNDVDWQKTKDIMFITNKAFMKAGPHKGKMVTW